MDSSSLVRTLREVPEFRLRLIDLAWEVAGENGLDPDKVAFYVKELKEAIGEAESYSVMTKEAVECLRELTRSQS